MFFIKSKSSTASGLLWDLHQSTSLSDKDWIQSSAVKQLVYHGTCADITTFRPLSHFSTRKAAMAGINRSRRDLQLPLMLTDYDWEEASISNYEVIAEYSLGVTYIGHLRMRRPAILDDVPGDHDLITIATELLRLDYISQKSFQEIQGVQDEHRERFGLEERSSENGETIALSAKNVVRVLRRHLFMHGHDGIRYKLIHEDVGRDAFIILDSRQFRFNFSL